MFSTLILIALVWAIGYAATQSIGGAFLVLGALAAYFLPTIVAGSARQMLH